MTGLTGPWWFRGTHAVCDDVLRRAAFSGAPASGVRIVDIGCGAGSWTPRLMRHGEVVAVDVASEALACCRKRGLALLVQGSAEHPAG